MKKNRILYISTLGMTEPLGRSQVMEYLLDLSQEFDISLYSFEKDLKKESIAPIQDELEDAGIHWIQSKYSNKYGVFSSVWQFLSSTCRLFSYVKNSKIQVIHARSLQSALIALMLRFFSKVKVIFDIRGFQIDEKAEVGRLKINSLFYRVLKSIENRAFLSSDAVVTLTQDSKNIIKDMGFKKVIHVIPTCANPELFIKLPIAKAEKFRQELLYKSNDIIIIHTGAVRNWYDFETEIRVIKELMLLDKNVHFLVLNKGEHEFIKNKVSELELPGHRVRIKSVDFKDVHKYLSIASASIYFIFPSYSKRASTPTKFAENLACKLFSVTNTGIGDMESYFNEFKQVGVILDLDYINSNKVIVAKKILNEIMNSSVNSSDYDKCFNKYFHKANAVQRYSNIYHSLSEQS